MNINEQLKRLSSFELNEVKEHFRKLDLRARDKEQKVSMFDLDRIDWLIEQAEMVEELQKQIGRLNQEIGGYSGRVGALTEELGFIMSRMKLLQTEMING